MDLGLQDKIALVTGVSSGIGAAAARNPCPEIGENRIKLGEPSDFQIKLACLSGA